MLKEKNNCKFKFEEISLSSCSPFGYNQWKNRNTTAKKMKRNKKMMMIPSDTVEIQVKGLQ